MKIYELEPNKMYKDPVTNICYMIDLTGSYAGQPIFASTQRTGLWDYCSLSYSDLLKMDFEPILERHSSLDDRINDSKKKMPDPCSRDKKMQHETMKNGNFGRE